MIVLNGGHRGPGGFRLDQPIGQGGMGVVWLGRHLDTDLPVAVKVLTGERARVPAAVIAFQREVAAVAALTHPGIVMVFDYGQIDAQAARASEGRLVEGSPFLVMEHAAEGTLAERCGRMGWPELRAALLSLLDALAHAHACDLIHRDIKPANVLVGGVRPGLKLSDFGLAYGGAGDAGGDVLQGGTPQFMAPEQAGGRTHEFGPWTDLYALGALGWSIASGAPPFPRPSLAAQGPPPLAPRVRMAVPRGLEGWLRRLLHHDPYQRYSRAADAAMALLELDDGDLIAASPRSPQESPRFHTLVNLGASTGEVETAIPRQPSQAGDTREGRWWEDAEGGAEVTPLLAITPPPTPDSWRRAIPPRPDVRLVGAGLGLYGLREIPLVGRESERDALWNEVRAVCAERRSRAVLLAGEAGAGKSRLARWLCQTVHEVGACSVLRAVHSDPPGATDGVVAMVERFLDARGLARPQVAEQLRRRLGLEDASEIGAFTELIRPLRRGEDPGRIVVVKLSTEPERLEAVARLLAVASRTRPLVVWLDDAQWGEDALRLAQSLLGRDLPILCVLTVRADVAASRASVGDAVEALRAGGARWVAVEALDASDRRGLVQRLLGLDDGLTQQVVERTEGNPLFAVQLVGDWVARGMLDPTETGFKLRAGAQADIPDQIHELWAGRVDHVLQGRVEESRRALELAAVLGVQVDDEEWAAACEQAGLVPAADLVDAMGMSGLVRATTRGWAFAHGMLMESIVRQCAAAGRADDLQLAASEALRRLGREKTERDPAAGLRMCDRARRCLASGQGHRIAAAHADSGRANAYYLLYRHTEARQAGEAALAVFRDAGEPRGAAMALARLGELAHARGELDVAERLLAEGVEIARTHGLGDVGEGLLMLVVVLDHRGRQEEARAAAEEGLRLAREAGRRRPQLRALGLLGDLAECAGDLRAAQRYLEEGQALVSDVDDRNHGLVAVARLANLDVARHRYTSAAERLERCRTGFRELAIPRNEAQSMYLLAEALIGMGQSAKARVLAQEAAHICEGIGSRLGEAEGLRYLASACLHQGDLLGARKHAEDALEQARGLGRVVEQILILLGSVRLASGDLQAARHPLEEALSLPALQTDRRQRIEVQLAVLARLAGDATEAERRLRAIVSTAPSEPQPHLAEAAGELAALLLHQDDADGAGEWANRALEWTEELERRWDSEPRRDLRSLPLGVLAELAAREGRSEDAWDRYEASVAWWEADPLLTRALHHCRRGRIALHLGDRERAAAALAAAEQIALQAAVGPRSPLCQETDALGTRLASSEA